MKTVICLEQSEFYLSLENAAFYATYCNIFPGVSYSLAQQLAYKYEQKQHTGPECGIPNV